MSRPSYKDVIIENLDYCLQNKGLRLYAYVIMNNHIHMIVSAREGFNLSDILRDFKKYTSKKILKEIETNIQESRRRWMLWIFKSAGNKNSNNQYYQFWQQDNHPIELSSNEMIDQRLDYIYMNPVKERIVNEPIHYTYSSAASYIGEKGLIPIDIIG